MSDKPSLHEIAAMPFPESKMAMRQHYNADWGAVIPDDAEYRVWSVEVRFSVRERESRTYVVSAYSEAEAEKMSERLFDEDKSVPCDSDVDDVIASQVVQS